MALDTYADLKTSITKWLDKSDTTTTNYVPDMIALAEAYFNRELRVDDMNFATASLTVTDGVATIPTGTRSILSVRETGSDHAQIKPKPMDEIERYEDLSTGFYQYYARFGGELHFWPRKSGTVRLRGRKSLEALSDSNTSNWLLEKHSDAYLYQALASGEAFNTNDERMPMWKALAQQAVDQINGEEVLFHEDALTPTPSTGIAV